LGDSVVALEGTTETLGETTATLEDATDTLGDSVVALEGTTDTLGDSVVALEATTADLQAAQEALQYMTVDENPINGLNGPHIIITGANLHIRDGSGFTSNGPLIGLGNVVVGYNEGPGGGLVAGDRDGTHNLIVGPEHKYLSFGGFLAGLRNTASGPNASVSGGSDNTASGPNASVSGGNSTLAPDTDDWAAGALFQDS
jgi:hypothetical protein